MVLTSSSDPNPSSGPNKVKGPELALRHLFALYWRNARCACRAADWGSCSRTLSAHMYFMLSLIYSLLMAGVCMWYVVRAAPFRQIPPFLPSGIFFPGQGVQNE
jgi:hypothetical protein